MSPVSLCAEKHYKELRKGIARTFRDGMGEKRLRMGEKCWKWWELLRMGGSVCRERRKPSEGSDLKWSTSIILGEVTCCFSNGCNLSLEMARESLVSWPFVWVTTNYAKKNDSLQFFHTLQEYLSHPLELNEMETIIQKAGSLVKLEEVEFSSPW